MLAPAAESHACCSCAADRGRRCWPSRSGRRPIDGGRGDRGARAAGGHGRRGGRDARAPPLRGVGAGAGRVLRIELEPGDRVERGKTVVARLQAGRADRCSTRGRGPRPRPVSAPRAAPWAGRGRGAAGPGGAGAGRARADSARSALAESGLTTGQAARRARGRGDHGAERGLNAARVRRRRRDVRARTRAGAAAARAARGAAAGCVPVTGAGRRRGAEALARERERRAGGRAAARDWRSAVDLEIVADLLSADAVRVQPGMRVLVEQWGGERPLGARVRRVEPAGFTKVSALGVEEQRVNVDARLDDDQRDAWQALGDGYRVEVRIVIWESAAVAEGADERAVPGRRAVGGVRGGRQPGARGAWSSWDSARAPRPKCAPASTKGSAWWSTRRTRWRTVPSVRQALNLTA